MSPARDGDKLADTPPVRVVTVTLNPSLALGLTFHDQGWDVEVHDELDAVPDADVLVLDESSVDGVTAQLATLDPSNRPPAVILADEEPELVGDDRRLLRPFTLDELVEQIDALIGLLPERPDEPEVPDEAEASDELEADDELEAGDELAADVDLAGVGGPEEPVGSQDERSEPDLPPVTDHLEGSAAPATPDSPDEPADGDEGDDPQRVWTATKSGRKRRSGVTLRSLTDRLRERTASREQEIGDTEPGPPGDPDATPAPEPVEPIEPAAAEPQAPPEPAPAPPIPPEPEQPSPAITEQPAADTASPVGAARGRSGRGLRSRLVAVRGRGSGDRADRASRLAHVAMAGGELERLAGEIPLLTSPPALARAIVAELAQTLTVDTAALWTREDDGYHCMAGHGLTPGEQRLIVPDDHPLVAQVRSNRGGVLIDPIDAAQAAVAGIGGAHTRSFAAANLGAGSVHLGVVTCGRERSLQPGDLDQLIALAGEAAPGMAVAKLLVRLATLVDHGDADRSEDLQPLRQPLSAQAAAADQQGGQRSQPDAEPHDRDEPDLEPQQAGDLGHQQHHDR